MTNPSASTTTNFSKLNKPELISKCEEFEAQMNQPAPQLSPMERRKQCASNTTVGIINRVLPITRKDGSAVEGGYKFWLTQSIEINYGTIESPDYQRIEVQSSPFTAWDNGTPENPNPVGTELFNLMKENDYAVVCLFWEFDGQGKGNVCLKDVTNTDEDGNINSEALDGKIKMLTGASPMQMIGEAEDQANLILYLASDASRFATGQIWRCNGGAPMVW